MASNKNFSKKYLIVVVALLVVIACASLELTNTTHFFHRSPKVSAPSTPLTQLSSKSSTTNKTPSAPTSTVSQVGANDEHGQVPSSVSTNPGQWSTSASGLVTLKVPAQNSTLKPGGAISGTAPTGQVQFRLIDNQVGVIAQGPISVVSGNFSATVNFKSYGSTGRLDVFTTDPSSGKETNEVQVPVNF